MYLGVYIKFFYLFYSPRASKKIPLTQCKITLSTGHFCSGTGADYKSKVLFVCLLVCLFIFCSYIRQFQGSLLVEIFDLIHHLI